MSSIASVGGGGSASLVGSSSGLKRNSHMNGLDQDLASFLSAQNVSADDQSQIQSEVKEALATAPGTRKPSLSALQDMVKKVLDKHGLSGDDFVSQKLTPTSKTGGTDAASSDGAGSASDDQAANGTGDASSTSDDSDISSIIQKLLASFGQSNSNNVGNSAQSGLFNTGSSGINANATLFDMIDIQA